MKTYFITNLPSPYRVDFFNELGKLMELTVVYERASASDRNSRWVGESAQTYNEIFAKLKPIGTDMSIGIDIVRIIKSGDFDNLIISGYASPSVMIAILYCKIKHIPYYIESDGGFCKNENKLKRFFKKFLLKKAKGHFTTCDEYKKYLTKIGIKEKCIYKYPFTSVKSGDIIEKPLTFQQKKVIRKNLSIPEERIILTVGQFIKRKGFDILISAASRIPKNVGIYFVGGTPTEEYIALKNEYCLNNIHFVGFKTKEELADYYKAADLFVLPTREDIWGLVINEAMAYGLPIITTNKCIAGLELVKNGANGYIVESENSYELADSINKIICDEIMITQMSKVSLDVIKEYTIEEMAKYHFEISEKI